MIINQLPQKEVVAVESRSSENLEIKSKTQLLINNKPMLRRLGVRQCQSQKREELVVVLLKMILSS